MKITSDECILRWFPLDKFGAMATLLNPVDTSVTLSRPIQSVGRDLPMVFLFFYLIITCRVDSTSGWLRQNSTCLICITRYFDDIPSFAIAANVSGRSFRSAQPCANPNYRDRSIVRHQPKSNFTLRYSLSCLRLPNLLYTASSYLTALPSNSTREKKK